MPHNKIHKAISKKRTGKTYEALHLWIDDDKEGYGADHRCSRHFYTKELRKYVFNNFGGHEAVSEWLFHIALDNLDTSVTNDWNNEVSDTNFHKFGFCGNGFIHYDEDELEEKDFERKFK